MVCSAQLWSCTRIWSVAMLVSTLSGLMQCVLRQGFDQVLLDYVHKRKFSVAGPAAMWALRGATVATLVGLYQFNTNDIGLTELVIRTWKA